MAEENKIEDVAKALAESLITIELNVRDVNYILGLLAKESYENVAELITAIRTQGLPQVAEIEQKLKPAAND